MIFHFGKIGFTTYDLNCLLTSKNLAFWARPASRVTRLRQLAGLRWRAGAKTLYIAALSLVYSTAEYCAPVWCYNVQTRLINSVLYDTLRIFTECLCPTPSENLPILVGIQQAKLFCLGVTLLLANRSISDPKNLARSSGQAIGCAAWEIRIQTPISIYPTEIIRSMFLNFLLPRTIKIFFYYTKYHKVL